MTILPEKALEQHIAILGITGSGKTFAAKGIVEGILSGGGHVCVIDPTGAWNGLRSSANGKKAGFPVVIFGGDHADVALSANSGEAIAEIVTTTDASCVLDTGNMTVRDQTKFLTAFAETLYRLNRKPLHLVIDEAHNIMPQGKVADPQSAMMLHAANRLLSQGRSRGLRVMMISQRPQKLHKDSLSQAQALIAMRVVAPQDRRAIEDWIGSWADPKDGADMMASLPSMETGEGWVWAPVAGVLKRVKFPPIKTYDSSRAPDGDAGNIVLARIDLPAIEARLETVAKEAVENDPKRLRAEIAELQRAKGKPDAEALRKAEEAGYARGRMDGRGEAGIALRVEVDGMAGISGRLRELLADLVTDKPSSARPFLAPKPVKLTPKSVQSQAKSVESTPKSVKSADISLPQGEKMILCALAQYPDGCTREQLTVLTGFKRSTRDAYIQRLRGKDYATVEGGKAFATPAGVDALGDAYEPLPTGQALRDYWLAKLPEGESKILSTLLPTYPDAVDREALSEETGFKRSTRDAYLQRMKAKQLIVIEGRGEVRAADTLFA